MNAISPEESDRRFMNEALKEAAIARSMEEIPIGAVIVCDGRVIARGHNMTQRLQDVTAHAEMIALTSAANHLNSKYLPECTLYVTVEPCIMCAGAAAWAQIGRIVYGAADPKKGYRSYQTGVLHPKTSVTHGIHEKECRELMTEFFRSKRGRPGAA